MSMLCGSLRDTATAPAAAPDSATGNTLYAIWRTPEGAAESGQQLHVFVGRAQGGCLYAEVALRDAAVSVEDLYGITLQRACSGGAPADGAPAVSPEAALWKLVVESEALPSGVSPVRLDGAMEPVAVAVQLWMAACSKFVSLR